jgi:GDPmannose 4,6-dehydratase
MVRAIITGITGQDGSYLADLLLQKGYEVHGLVRRDCALGESNIRHLMANTSICDQSLFLHFGDITDATSLRELLAKTSPAEVYHLAGQSHVGRSADQAEATGQMTGMGTLRLLEAIRHLGLPCRLLNASSSEIFGQPETSPQNELTPMRPATVYGCAKAFATQLSTVYRRTFGLFAVNAILYNHESPRRGESFVTQKICRAAAAIKAGRQEVLTLGNAAALRDWGDAREYVQGMWLAMQHPTPEDFVLATGRLHSVQEAVEVAFAAMGLDWRRHVRQDLSLLRAEEPSRLAPALGAADRRRRRARCPVLGAGAAVVAAVVDEDRHVTRGSTARA